jgi:NADPH:quinone reductase-like Zn-dependent oxidoreductase
MAKAVVFTEFGGPEVLRVVEVDEPVPGDGDVLVAVVAAGTNPVESAARSGVFPQRWPVAFPARQGRDLAGIVVAVGADVDAFAIGDAVLGFVERGSQATHVLVPQTQLVHKPQHVSWEVAGGLYVAGTTALDAVHNTGISSGDTVIVTAAAGGVGCLAVQLALRAGARVIGTASERNFDYLRDLGAQPLPYGSDLAARVHPLAPHGVNAFIDFFGADSVEAAVELGVPPARINTVLDVEAVDDYGVELATAGDVRELERIAHLIAANQIRMPIADVFAIDDVADAYRQLDRRESLGKIVIGMHPVHYRGERLHNIALKEQDLTLGVPTPHPRTESIEALPPVFGHRRGHAPSSPEDPHR